MIPSGIQEPFFFFAPPWLWCGFHPHDSKWLDPPLGIMTMFKAGRRDKGENRGFINGQNSFHLSLINFKKLSPKCYITTSTYISLIRTVTTSCKEILKDAYI